MDIHVPSSCADCSDPERLIYNKTLGICKRCYDARQYQKHKRARKAKAREYRENRTAEQMEQARVRSRRYRESHREETNAANRAYEERFRARDPEGWAELRRQSSRAFNARRRAILHEAKSKPCADCGLLLDPRVMDLHHRDPSEKLFAPSQGVRKTLSVLLAEIAKCDVLCANCHRARHAK